MIDSLEETFPVGGTIIEACNGRGLVKPREESSAVPVKKAYRVIFSDGSRPHLEYSARINPICPILGNQRSSPKRSRYLRAMDSVRSTHLLSIHHRLYEVADVFSASTPPYASCSRRR